MKALGKQKIIKQINRKRIINLLREADEISVAELSKKVSLSKPTIMKIMKYFIYKGLVVISGKGSSTEEGGKKPNIFKFNKNGGYAIGMAITANKLKSTLTNLKGEMIGSFAMDLRSSESVDSVVDKISSSYNNLIEISEVDSSKIIGMAVGIYGLTDSDKGVVYYSPRYKKWGTNIEMQDRIQEKIPENIPVILDNLPRFQVFAEKSLGVARNLRNVISIFAGYGLGAGILIEGEIKRGQHKIMGEVGHMVINPTEDLQCACGAHGCFEVMVSIDRIKKLLELNSSRYDDSMVFSNNGRLTNVSPEEIFNAYINGDELVTFVMDDIIEWFAIGLSNIILIFDPQVVVIHGIYTKAGDKFLNRLKEKVEQISLTNIKKETKIEFSKLGNDAGVLGAATYVINEFFA